MSEIKSADLSAQTVPVVVGCIKNSSKISTINQRNKSIISSSTTPNVSPVKRSINVLTTTKSPVLPTCLAKLSNFRSVIQVASGSNPSIAKPLFVVAPNVVSLKSVNIKQVSVPECNAHITLPQNHQLTTVTSSALSTLTKTASTNKNIKTAAVFSTISDSYAFSSKAGLTSQDPNNWDPFSGGDQITVSCKKKHAILDKRKLGSGQRGKCVLFEDKWITPSEFEVACGLSTSRDWKRSIRHGAFTLLKLINEGHLKPHSAACTCAICSDDNSITCPVRLFQPYKRRKRSSNVSKSLKESVIPNKAAFLTSNARNISLKNVAAPQSYTASNPSMSSSVNQTTLSSDAESIIHLVMAESQLAEQCTWWKLEEMSNNLLDQAKQLKQAVTKAKTDSYNQRLNLMRKLAVQLHKEQNPESSVTQPTITYAQVLHPSAVLPSNVLITTPAVRSLKQQDVKSEITNSLQFCNACGNHAVSECTGCHKATYCSTACQEKDWLQGHSEVCLLNSNAEQSIKDKAEKALVIRSSPSDVDSYHIMSTATVLPK